MLAVRLFGAPQILVDGVAVVLPRRKSRALIYYLAAHAEPVTREHVLAFLWPDSNRVSGQQTLRATLYSVRKTLNSAIVVDDAGLSLASGADVDSRKLEAAVLHPAESNDAGLQATLEL